MGDLTPKQERFCEQYIIDLNASVAYQRAGYVSTGNAAEASASKLLRNPKVAARISELKAARAQRTQITADRVLLEYARVAFSDMREFTEWAEDGVKWKDSKKLSDDAAACVAEVSETISEGGRTRRFKLHSKTAALADLAKHLEILGPMGSGGAGNSGGLSLNQYNFDLRQVPTDELARITGIIEAASVPDPGQAGAT